MKKVELFEMTEEERAAIEAERQAHKEWEKTHLDEHTDRFRLLGEWERPESNQGNQVGGRP